MARLTKKQTAHELMKCGKDPAYFIKNYVRISHPTRGVIPFNLFPFQEDVIHEFGNHRFNIALKARQLGLSTTVAGYALWMLLFYRDKNILVVATKRDTAGNLLKKVRQMYDRLPKWMKISDIAIDNRYEFRLKNGSEMKASASSSDAGRSEALSMLIVDEAAHVDGLDDLWAALYPTLSTGGRCIALSTPNGVGNWFHRNYTSAENGINVFNPIKLLWNIHPERDQSWFENETRNMPPRQIAQELECSFNASGDTVISPKDIAHLFEMTKEPEYKTGFDHNLWIWENRIEEFTYFICADVARGDGNDSSVFHVVKAEKMEIVAEYQGKPSLSDFSHLLASTGKEYGNCLLVVEVNNLGISVIEKLQELEYPNMYYAAKSTHEYVESHMAAHTSNVVPGFTTSSKTRPLIIAKMEEFIRNRMVKSYSSRFVDEIKTFIWQNGKPQAMRSYHDDLIMAFAIACWVRDTAITVNKTEIEYQKAMVMSIGRTERKIHTTIPGQTGHIYRGGVSEKAYAEREKYRKFIWLLKG